MNNNYLYMAYWMISAIQTIQIWMVRCSMKNHLEKMGMNWSCDAALEAIL